MVDMLGNDTWRAAGQLMEFTYYAPADPTSVSPEGHTILRAEECFPYALHGLGGPEAWDGPLRHELLRARNEVMAELVPGWDEMVLDQYDWTPLDNWRLNRAARFGQVRRLARGAQLDGGGLQRCSGAGRGRRGALAGVVAGASLRVVPAQPGPPAGADDI
jgi:hypothetical protein